MEKIVKTLIKKTGFYKLILGLSLVVLVGIADYITGYQVSSSLVYILPIALITWIGGIKLGIAISVASIVSWGLTNIVARGFYQDPAIVFWNIFVRLSIFLIISHILWKLKIARKKQADLIDFIVHDLKTPLAMNILGLEELEEKEGTALTERQRAY